jgi:hypothetical protein
MLPIGLSSNQLIDHVNGSGKEDLDVGIAGRIGEAFGQEGLAGTGVANANDIAVCRDKVEMKQLEDTIFLLRSGLMVVEVELVNGEFFFEP